MRVTSLASGSTGNALLIEAGPQHRTRLLVDAGLTNRLLIERLRRAGVSPMQLQGVLLTHEHGDHTIGLPHLMTRFSIPAFADPRTLEAIETSLISGIWYTDSGTITARLPQPGIETELTRTSPFKVGSRSFIGDIEVYSFPVSHDAVAPCGYLLSADGYHVCIAIDTGTVTPTMLKAMKQADLLIIESNHDRQRLLNGPYPHALKQRILSNKGHLSNDQAAEAVLQTWRHHSMRWVWLSHLSRTNNTPQLALDMIRSHIRFARIDLSQAHITALPPGMGATWDSAQLCQTPSLWEM